MNTTTNRTRRLKLREAGAPGEPSAALMTLLRQINARFPNRTVGVQDGIQLEGKRFALAITDDTEEHVGARLPPLATLAALVGKDSRFDKADMTEPSFWSSADKRYVRIFTREGAPSEDTRPWSLSPMEAGDADAGGPDAGELNTSPAGPGRSWTPAEDRAMLDSLDLEGARQVLASQGRYPEGLPGYADFYLDNLMGWIGRLGFSTVKGFQAGYNAWRAATVLPETGDVTTATINAVNEMAEAGNVTLEVGSPNDAPLLTAPVDPFHRLGRRVREDTGSGASPSALTVLLDQLDQRWPYRKRGMLDGLESFTDGPFGERKTALRISEGPVGFSPNLQALAAAAQKDPRTERTETLEPSLFNALDQPYLRIVVRGAKKGDTSPWDLSTLHGGETGAVSDAVDETRITPDTGDLFTDLSAVDDDALALVLTADQKRAARAAKAEGLSPAEIVRAARITLAQLRSATRVPAAFDLSAVDDDALAPVLTDEQHRAACAAKAEGLSPAEIVDAASITLAQLRYAMRPARREAGAAVDLDPFRGRRPPALDPFAGLASCSRR